MLIAESHETLDAAFLKWFLNMLSQNVPLHGAIIQEKVSIYVKELKIKQNFEASDCLLRCWKERRNIAFKTISRIANAWKETLLSTQLPNYELKKSIMLTSLDYFTNVESTKHTNSNQKSAQVKS